MSSNFQVQGFNVISEYATNLASSDTTNLIAQMKATGANSIELTPLYFTNSGTSSNVTTSVRSESDADLIAGIKAAEAAGLSVILKPHLKGLDGTDADNLAPSDPAKFFASYQAQIVHLATIAQATGVTTFSIGNELSNLTGAQDLPYWTSLISAVRSVYSGSLTYAAKSTEASSVSFWSQLDIVGVNMYPQLSSTTSPTVANLVSAWNSVPTDPSQALALNNQSPVDFLHSLSTQYGKPALITETGYRSITGTASNPGDYQSAGISDAQAQANAYQALAQVWGSETGSWFKGVEFLQGDTTNAVPSTSYSPLGKPAQAIVTQLFNGQLPSSGLTIRGSTLAQTLDYSNSHGNDVIIGGLANDTIKGGSGNDTIFAGPSSLAPLKATTVTITGYGSMAGGVGAQMQLLVNGVAVGDTVTYTTATDPSGYQTYTFTFANTAPVTSLDLAFLNPGSGKALHVRSIDVNGVALSPTQATNTSAPGTFDLYGGSLIHFNTTANQAMFVGSGSANDLVIAGSGNDTVYGGAGNDTMVAGAGNDTFVGGTGTSTVVFAGKSSDYTIIWNGSTATVTDKVSGRDGIDTLTNITSVKFADKTMDMASMVRPLAARLALVSNVATVPVNYVWTASMGNTPYASQVTAYDNSGHIVGSSQYYANGSLYSTTTIATDGGSVTKQYSATGVETQLVTVGTDGSVDVKLYDASGALSTDTLSHADGSRDRYDYGLVGRAYASDHLVYNAVGSLVDTLQSNADGSLYAETKVLANGSVEQDQYAGGKLAQSVVTASNGGNETKTYVNGALSVDSIHNADGTKSYSTYGITGQAYVRQTFLSDTTGRQTAMIRYYAAGGVYTSTIYAADGSSVAQTFDTSGHRTVQISTAANGSTDIVNYASSGATLNETVTTASGHTYTQFGITGQSFTTQATTYDTTGRHTSLTQLYANGGTYSTTTYASDGSATTLTYDQSGHQIDQNAVKADGSSVETVYSTTGGVTSTTSRNSAGKQFTQFGIAGQAYTKQTFVFDPTGRQTAMTRYYAAGGVYTSTTYAADGSSVAQTFDTAGHLTSQFSTAATGATDAINYATSGTKLNETVTTATGHTYTQFGMTGQPFATQVTTYDAAGRQTSMKQLYANGATYGATTNASDGSATTLTYDASGHQIDQLVVKADGSSVETASSAAGVVTSITTRGAAGKQLTQYGITGQPYASQTFVFDTTGRQTQMIRSYASGGVYSSTTYAPDGSTVVQSFDPAGHLTSKFSTMANGTTDAVNYATNGAMLNETVASGTGHTYSQFGMTGQPFTTQVTTYDAAGRQTSMKQLYANGATYGATTNASDGSATTLTYDASGHQIDQLVVKADGSSVETASSAAGVVTSMTTRGSTGKQYTQYGITGQPYASQTFVFDTTGRQTQMIRSYANGGVYGSTTYAIDGSSVAQTFDPAGHLTSRFTTSANGATDAINYDLTGAKLNENVKTASGRTYTQFGMTGQPYTTQSIAYDASGRQISMTQLYASGATYQAVTNASDGSSVATIYSAAGAVTDVKQYLSTGTLASETKTLANGSNETDRYTAGSLATSVITAPTGAVETKTYSSGALTTDLVRNTDGTTVSNLYGAGHVVQQTVTNLDGTQQISSNQSGLALDASGRATGARSVALYDAAGHQTVSQVVASDGSMQITGLAQQATLAGGSGNDTLTSFGGDTLVFTAQSGHDTIAKFYAGLGASSDIIDIKAAGVSDMQHLSMTQTGADVLVGINAQSNILIKNTALAQLTAHNFAFG